MEGTIKTVINAAFDNEIMKKLCLKILMMR